MRIPANTIIESKYTIGNEYVDKKTHKDYQGYYYELNGKFFKGKEFDPRAPEIIKIKSNKINNLLLKASTSVFGALYGKNINVSQFSSLANKKDLSGRIRYFCKKLNYSPILIKEISKDNYDLLKTDPLYQVISIEFPEGGYFGEQKYLEEADKEMPGIKEFILSDLPPD